MDVDLPELIPIAWLPGLETEYVGLTRGERQFMGFVLSLPPRDDKLEDTPQTRRWVAFVHLFTLEGAHIGTLYKNHGALADDPNARDLAHAELQLMLDELGPLQHGDIAVQPFEAKLAGETAGLYVKTNEAGPYCVLEPNGLAFGPPWNGDYEVLA